MKLGVVDSKVNFMRSSWLTESARAPSDFIPAYTVVISTVRPASKVDLIASKTALQNRSLKSVDVSLSITSKTKLPYMITVPSNFLSASTT